jgi:hypothetical protein
MAAVPVTFQGILFFSDIGVGGGPMPGGSPPSIWPSPGVPTHPIAGPPPGIWPSPGVPTHPWIPPGGPGIWPTPPGGFYPDQGLPGQQPGIWPSPGVPTHPIVLPPDLPPTLPPPDSRPIEWKTAWTPQTGWVVVGVPTGPHPAPSTPPA